MHLLKAAKTVAVLLRASTLLAVERAHTGLLCAIW
jgi:hypothetical protein